MTPRFLGRQARRHLIVAAFAAVFGGIVVLILETMVFRPRPVPLPVIISGNPVQAPPGSLAPHEMEARIHVNPCVDLHSYVCTLVRAEDPTGYVRRDSEGEVEALRIYENIIRTHRKLTMEKIDGLLVRKIYTPDRTGRIRELFAKAKEHLLQFIDAQPFQALSALDKDLLRRRIERVELELPPPASVYGDEPDLFTRNDVYYERTADGSVRIRIGGALLFTVRSKFNLAFTLVHELAHSIDPCELRADNVDILSYQKLSECFGSPAETLSQECSPYGKLSEIFADWVATHVVADLIGEASGGYTPSQLRSAVYSAVRDLCREDDEDGHEDEPTLSSSHPSVAFRVNRIFSQHPKIRKFLGCKEQAGPTLPGVPSYCFWAGGNAIKGGRKE